MSTRVQLIAYLKTVIGRRTCRYVAVFDTLKHDPPPHGRSQQFRGFGITWSRDGLEWTAADVVDVGAEGARTPLRLLAEPDGTVSVYYTICPCGRPVPERVWRATFRLVNATTTLLDY